MVISKKDTPLPKHRDLGKKQDLLNSLFSNCFGAVMLLGQNMEFLYLNLAATQLIGYQLKGNEHLSLLSICTKESANELQVVLDEINKSPGSSKSLKLKIKHLYGQVVDLECSLINRLQDVDVSAIIFHFAAANTAFEIKTALEDQLQKMAWFESVVTYTKDAVVITQVHHQPQRSEIIFVNAAFTAMTGYTLSEVFGKSPRFLHGPNTDQQQLDQLSECMARWEPCEITIVNYKKNGEEFWVDLAIAPMTDHQGNYTHWMAIERDVTKQKELESLLQNATSLAGIGGWDYDCVHEKLSCTTITRQIFELNDEEDLPTLNNLSHFFKNEQQLKECLQHFTKAQDDGRPFDFEVEILTAKSNSRWIRVIGKAEFNASNCTRIRGSFQDIDARKKSELLVLDTMREKMEILESIGDAFFALDLNWNVTYWNGKAELLLHKRREEMIGHNLWDVFADYENTHSYEEYHWAVHHQKVVHFETYYQTLKTWYEISAYPSESGLAVYFKDITQRKLSEKEIIDSEKRYSDLFHLSPIPKWVFDIDTYKFLDVNRTAVKHYGYSRKEFLNMTIFDIRPAHEIERTKNVIRKQVKNTLYIVKGVFTHIKKNGQLIRVEIRSAIIQFRGKPAKIVIANDVTEQEKYVKAIEEQNQKLKEVSWIQSHIFRAPLARIQGLVPLVEHADNGKEQKWILDRISESADELDGIIKDITAKTKI